MLNPYIYITAAAIGLGSLWAAHRFGYQSGYEDRDKIAVVDMAKIEQASKDAQDEYNAKLTGLNSQLVNFADKLKESQQANASRAKQSTRLIKRDLDEHKDFADTDVPLNIDRVRLDQINQYNCIAAGSTNCAEVSGDALPYVEN